MIIFSDSFELDCNERTNYSLQN